MPVNAYTVTFAAALTAVATGLGALPFLFVTGVSRRNLGLANGAAAGLMLAASAMLLYEGAAYSLLRVLVGAGIGVVGIAASRALLDNHSEVAVGRLRGADALQALMIVGIMTAHSFAEGVGVGVSYGGGDELGAFITAAIAVHNIPEGLAISLVLIPRGTSLWKAAGWSIFTSLPQPLMAVPAFLFVLVFEPFLPIGFGLAAGAMIWMVFAELIPDALDTVSGATTGAAVTLAFAVLFAFQHFVL